MLFSEKKRRQNDHDLMLLQLFRGRYGRKQICSRFREEISYELLDKFIYRNGKKKCCRQSISTARQNGKKQHEQRGEGKKQNKIYPAGKAVSPEQYLTDVHSSLAGLGIHLQGICRLAHAAEICALCRNAQIGIFRLVTAIAKDVRRLTVINARRSAKGHGNPVKIRISDIAEHIRDGIYLRLVQKRVRIFFREFQNQCRRQK